MSSLGHQLATSVLVVGAGKAGLRAAIEVAEAGVAVMAVHKRTADDIHTVVATGGSEGGPGIPGPGAIWERHAADTLYESRLLADPRTAQIVAHHAAQGFHDM